MKYIKQVDIQLGGGFSDGRVDVAYQNSATYITLAISDWVRLQKLNIEEATRIVFSEYPLDQIDMEVKFKNVLSVNLSPHFGSLNQISNSHSNHEYFTQKYLEGFARLDAKFGLNLTPALDAFLKKYFEKEFVYEKEMKSKVLDGLKYQVIKQYKFDAFNLIVRVSNTKGAFIKESILKTAKPDPILVGYSVNKITFLEDKIQVFANTGLLESAFSLQEIA